MGRVLKKLGRIHDALAAFNHALDLDPKVGAGRGGRGAAAGGGLRPRAALLSARSPSRLTLPTPRSVPLLSWTGVGEGGGGGGVRGELAPPHRRRRAAALAEGPREEGLGVGWCGGERARRGLGAAAGGQRDQGHDRQAAAARRPPARRALAPLRAPGPLRLRRADQGLSAPRRCSPAETARRVHQPPPSPSTLAPPEAGAASARRARSRLADWPPAAASFRAGGWPTDAPFRPSPASKYTIPEPFRPGGRPSRGWPRRGPRLGICLFTAQVTRRHNYGNGGPRG